MADPTVTAVIRAVLQFLIIIPAIIVHEVAHGWVAHLLGDPTAKERGRLTLNPIPHMDLQGTVIMPLLLLFVSGGKFAFGYAKPVPVNPYRMTKTDPQTGMLLTGAAGPAVNIVMAIAMSGVYRAMTAYNALTPDTPPISAFVLSIFSFFVIINLVLAFFNLIPLPPLDGSRIIQRFLKGKALDTYASLEPYGFAIVIGLAFVLPWLTNDAINPLSLYFEATVYPIATFLLGLG